MLIEVLGGGFRLLEEGLTLLPLIAVLAEWNADQCKSRQVTAMKKTFKTPRLMPGLASPYLLL